MEYPPSHLNPIYPRAGPPIYSIPSPSFPPPPYTTPSLTANLICRVLFAILANFACLVPLRLLCRNGELAAVVFILNVELQNLRTIVNALLWRNDDTSQWWSGEGLCDVDAYLHNVAIGLYSTCLLAIMRNLARQVGVLRAHPLSIREKRKRNIVQALIIFPLPLIQMAWTFPLTARRYLVGTLVGCSWAPYPAWPYLIFIVLAPAVVALIAAVYAVLTYLRFRQVAKTTESALSSNRVASQRSQRTKRRLYLMVISILAPFLPVVIALAVLNIINMGPLRPFDYNVIRNSHRQDSGGAMLPPWNTVVFLPLRELDFLFLNNCYICILSAVPIFLFFGMTKDAINSYRTVLLFFRLDRLFPSLGQEYDPDRAAFGSGSFGSLGSHNPMTVAGPQSQKATSFSSSNRLASLSGSSTRASSPQNHEDVPSLNFLSSVHFNNPESARLQRPQLILPRFHSQDVHTPASPRNPFPFRTRFNFAIPFRYPFSTSSNTTTSTSTSSSKVPNKSQHINSTSNITPNPIPLHVLPPLRLNSTSSSCCNSPQRSKTLACHYEEAARIWDPSRSTNTSPRSSSSL